MDLTREDINRYIIEIQAHRVSLYRYESSIRKRLPAFADYIGNISSPLDNKGKPMGFMQKLWHVLNHDETFSLGVCASCGKRTHYKDGTYKTYCSCQCATQSEALRTQWSSIRSSKEHQEKMIRIFTEKFGVDHPMKNTLVKEKIKNTCKERYGVESPMQCEAIRQKSRKTCLERYGHEYVMQNDNIMQKSKKTLIKKYGVDNSMKYKATKDKAKKTMLNRYGVEHALQKDVFREKSMHTCLVHYGVEHPFQSEYIKAKIKQTTMDRYGVYQAMKNKDVQSKLKKVILDKYGVEYTFQNVNIRKKSDNTKRKNGTFNTSRIEEYVANWLNSENIEFKRQYKSKEYPFYCDFYLVDYQLYIEINGSWVHGHRPFDTNDPECVCTLNIWKEKATTSSYYANAIKVWTDRDVAKREYAKANNLKHIEIYSIDPVNVITEIHKQISNYSK